MSSDIWQSREWTDYVRKVVSYYSQNSRAKFNSHDWDDLAQIATLHVWKNRAKCDVSKPLKPWLKTVTLSSAKNEIRRRKVYSPDHVGSRTRYNIRNPLPLITRFVVTEDDIEEIVYLPDVVDPSTEWKARPTEDQLIGVLKRDKPLLAQLLTGSTVSTLALQQAGTKTLKRSKRARRFYTIINKARNRLKAAYIATLDAQ